MTLPLPPWDGTREGLQFILDRISLASTDTGGLSLKLRIGTGTVTWAGATSLSGATTVTHGLGSAPVAVLLQDSGGLVGISHIPIWVVVSPTTTSFQILAETSDAAVPVAATTRTCYWMAVG